MCCSIFLIATITAASFSRPFLVLSSYGTTALGQREDIQGPLGMSGQSIRVVTMALALTWSVTSVRSHVTLELQPPVPHHQLEITNTTYEDKSLGSLHTATVLLASLTYTTLVHSWEESCLGKKKTKENSESLLEYERKYNARKLRV